MIIRRIDPVSLGKIQGLVMAVFGLIGAMLWGGMLAIGGMAAMNAGGPGGGPGGGPPAGVGALMGGLALVMVIAMPVMYGVMGFVGGIIAGVVYNLASGFLGGLEIEVDFQGEHLETES